MVIKLAYLIFPFETKFKMMNQAENVAVITGDIVGSGEYNWDERMKLIGSVRTAIDDLKKNKILKDDDLFEVFQGDSFQLMMNAPQDALKVILIIRCALRNCISAPKKKEPDARISIGIGQVPRLARTLMESDGEAFRLSGRYLEVLKNETYRLGIRTGQDDVNKLLDLISRAVDFIVSDWTFLKSGLLYHYLLTRPTQVELAQLLGISQTNVSKQLRAANFDLLQLHLDHYSRTIKTTFQ